jgi:hypothetical protein
MAGFDVVFGCPETGKAVRTGVALAQLDAFYGTPLDGGVVPCPHCGRNHAWARRDVWLHAVPSLPIDAASQYC